MQSSILVRVVPALFSQRSRVKGSFTMGICSKGYAVKNARLPVWYPYGQAHVGGAPTSLTHVYLVSEIKSTGAHPPKFLF